MHEDRDMLVGAGRSLCWINLIVWRNGGGPWMCILRKWHIFKIEIL